MTTHTGQANTYEETIRRFFGIYEDHAPHLFPEIISPEYRDLGHEPLGIGVTIVEPGYFRTDFLDASSVRWNDTTIDDYRETARGVRQYHETMNHNQPGDPGKLGRAVVELTQLDEPPLHFLAGSDAYDVATAEFQNRLSEAQKAEARSRATDAEVASV